MLAEPPPVALAPRHLNLETVPAHGNALAIDAVLCVRPAEWGASSPVVEGNFESETIDVGYGPNTVGLFSHLNTDDYNAKVSGMTPRIYQIEAVLLVQAALQVAPALIHAVVNLQLHEAFAITQMGSAKFQPQYRVSPAATDLMAGTTLLVPNVVRTFKFRDNTVCAPCLLAPGINIAIFALLKQHRGPIQFSGLPMLKAGPVTMQPPLLVQPTYDQRAAAAKSRKKENNKPGTGGSGDNNEASQS